MKAFFRLILSVCLLAPLASGVGPANAEVTSDSCTEIFSVTASNLSGAAVAGTPLSVEVAVSRNGWEQRFGLDYSMPSPGVLNVCAPTDAQLDELEFAYGDEFDPNFETGTKVAISYLPDGNNAVTQFYRHLLTSAQASAANAKSVSVLPGIVVTSVSQIPVSIKDSTGTLQANAPWEIWEEIKRSQDGQTWTDVQFVTYGNTDVNGSVKVAGIANGNYQLYAYPGDAPSADAMQTKASFKVVVGVATFASTNVASGILTLRDANVKFRIVGENNESLDSMNIYPYINDEDINGDAITRRSDGYFVANVPDKDLYELEVYAGGESRYASTKFTFEVAAGLTTFKKDSVVVGGTALQMDLSNFAFKALDIAGDAVKYPSIMVFSAVNCPNESDISSSYECDPNYKYVDTGLNGIGTAKIADGTYWVSMDPSYGGTFGSVKTLVKFTILEGVLSSDSALATPVAAVDPGSAFGLNTLIVKSSVANLKANVTTQSGVALTGGFAYSYPLCQNFCADGEFTSSSANIDAQGRIALYLPAASTDQTREYAVTVEPSGRYAAAATQIRLTATVDDQGIVTAVEPPSHLLANVTPPEDGFWNFRLPTPNFSGTVLMPAGSEAVPYAGIQIQKWVNEQYTGTKESDGIYVDESGKFKGYLVPGRYQVLVEPPYDAPGVSANSYEILIAEDSSACFFDGSNTTCEVPIAAGSFDLRLSLPNVIGEVRKSGQPLSSSQIENASVELRKWNSQNSYWEWERWSQVGSDSGYSFNIESAGTYQIMANPGYLEGYALGSEYLVVAQTVSGLTFCKIPEPGLDTLSAPTCPSEPTPGPITANIELQQANFQANVTVPSNFEGWVYAGVSKVEVQGSFESYMHSGNLELRRTADTNVFKGFSSLDDNNGNPAKYRIDFDSYSENDAGLPLARSKSYLWAHNFDTADSDIEICPETYYDKDAKTCASGELLDSTTPLSIELTNGNLSGAVLTPNSEPVPYGWLQAQKWQQTEWSGSNYTWNWMDLSANVNSVGAFALNIEDPGFYKVQARQQWGGTLPYADSFTLIKVDDSGDWCVIDGDIASYSELNSPTASTECVLGRDNEPNDLVAGLTLRLEEPKITGTLKLVSGNPAANAYIWIRKWNSTQRYYEHTEYAITNGEGKFFINPSDGDYQLEFNPGWSDRLSQIGYEKTLCVGAVAPSDRPSDAGECAPTYELDTERFLPPNLSGIVCPASDIEVSCIDDGVRNSWIEVREMGSSLAEDPNTWSWIRGTSTDSDGKFGLKLTAGTIAQPNTYSLRVYPSNPEQQGVGKRLIVSIGEDEAGESECKIGSTVATLALVAEGCSSLKIGMLSPNVSGTLTFNNTYQEPIKQLMLHSWVSIYGENYTSYVTGANTDGQGKFATVLEADGIYFLDSYSNSRYATRSTLRLTVKVETTEGVTSVSWKYRNQSDDAYVTMPLDADFDFIPPNVKINLSPGLTGSHIILVKDLEIDPLTREQPRRFVSSGTLASGVLTLGKTYSVKVIANYQETLAGDCAEDLTVTVPEGDTLNGIALADLVDLSTCETGS